ncbi:hypothetical protein, partial [Vibrio sp. 03_296]|uniref:hypothetical protein n=1 Tax=Vibrio sp. 03_296 TaxID=2024409 RepID=UPI002D7FD07B
WQSMIIKSLLAKYFFRGHLLAIVIGHKWFILFLRGIGKGGNNFSLNKNSAFLFNLERNSN